MVIAAIIGTWAVCVALPDLVVIPAGVVRKYGPKLWEKIRRRSPKE